ncbi:MAG: prepilin-type N-terminal cleavage/methylation domain-containing protein [Cellulomonas sp. 73-145]|uniref:PulJ/GspJ family protein n=1 Tax=Cellulomonas sp. 73-145 TaxID=1895739 RepID=UPI000928B068|nr:type II secretion system protein [Cellulomonas sp. 73-145]MBN9327188.1 type II secretion system protein [Cellulomonas sp.]OJV57502.1 MAG: prepilin-type N-terminal cleavage/methylation domain-containing protein [Cellulomonas sp. 73-145]
MRDVLRRRMRDGAPDRGTTLAELLVATVVFAIAMAMIMSAAIAVMHATDSSRSAADAAYEARQALAMIDRQVRSGNVLFSPADEAAYISTCQNLGTNQGSCMRIYTQSNGDEKCVQWQLAADGTGTYQLKMRSWKTTWQTTGGVSGWTVAARNLVMPSAPFTLDVGPGGIYGSRLLRVQLVAHNATSGKDVAIDGSISGRNTTYGYTGSECLPVPPA